MDVKASLIATASRDGTVNLYSIGQVKCYEMILSLLFTFYGFYEMHQSKLLSI